MKVVSDFSFGIVKVTKKVGYFIFQPHPGFDFLGGYGIIGTDKRWVGRYLFGGKFSSPWYMF